MIQRSQKKEILDITTPRLTELREAMLDIGKTNKIFLNHWLIYNFVGKLISKTANASILDIGTGGGDIPKSLAEKFKNSGQIITVTGIDINPNVLTIARQVTANTPHVTILEKPLSEINNNEFTVAVMSQMLHHLTPEEAVEIIKTAITKVTQGIVISDFIRSRLNFWLAKISLSLLRQNAINKNDGPLSVLRSYSDSEIAEIMNKAGITKYKIHNFLVRKIIVIYK